MWERLRRFVRHDNEAVAELCELGDAVHNAVEICRPRIRDNAQLEVVVETTDAPSVRARKAELASALVNLVVNACEAMAAGGRITLRTGSQEGRAWVEVEDDGPSIAPEIREHVLDSFFTTKETGTGLGLSVVSTFMQKSAGSVEIESEVGRGTRIRLDFPAATTPV